MDVRRPKIISNAELWEAAGQRPKILQIRMRKWLWIGHTLRKGMNPLKNKRWVVIRREPEAEENRSKHGKRPF
jgi:hypothetical protein